uniref:Dipeptidylpeptidase IV N-terminal domain-containing protein n=1 Tax=candidate division CPR3 bacterium TaxID=2268181 RepID=A0A7C4R327_UNCC3
MKIDLKKIILDRKIIILLLIFIVIFVVIFVLISNSNKIGKEISDIEVTEPEKEVIIKEIEKTKKIIDDPIKFPALSNKGDAIYYQNFKDGFFYKLDLSSGLNKKISREIRMISDVIWSPDKSKAIFLVKQDNYFFEKFNSPFKNANLEDGSYTYWFYDFSNDFIKKIGDENINKISWSPDNVHILYHYLNITDLVISGSISILNPYEEKWTIVKENITNDYNFGFIDSENIFLLWQPTFDDFECDIPTLINLKTKNESNLIDQNFCFVNISINPKSKWGIYSDISVDGFININTKDSFNFDFGPSNIPSEYSYSNDGKYYYGFKNGSNLNDIYKIDLEEKRVKSILKTSEQISDSEQIIISPDEKYVYFLLDQYLYQTEIIK